ncbi:hypothetical protein [Xanthomonas oryzae pv. oryzae MAFF 311018]|nr:hypothetical protein [Xanthomonas oryzae pv. oryzae MAFF 311018]
MGCSDARRWLCQCLPRRSSTLMIDQPTTVELQATGVRFFSRGDETAFFGWIKSFPFVEQIEGHGRTLFMKVNSSAIDEDGLRELLALFRRYGVDMAQLVAFDREEFAEWFRRADAYWHNDIFGSSSTSHNT